MTPYYSKDGIDLFLGDCRDVLPALIGVAADSLVTDPPYSIENKFGSFARRESGFGNSRRLEFDWDKAMSSTDVCESVRVGLQKCATSASFFVFCGTDQVGGLLPVMREEGFTPKPAAWVKKYPPPPAPGNWWPSAFELAFYGYRNSPYFGDSRPNRSNVFSFDTYRYGKPGKVDHPTQKPLDLISQIVESVVPANGLCLDLFAGSGTTLRAAKDLGRRAIGIEIHEPYAEIAAKRLEQGVLQFE